MTDSVSVVIATRNRRVELLRALASLAKQTAPHETIVCDDASTDGTTSEVAEAHPDVRLMPSESALGVIAQRNRGVAVARHPIVCFIDDDCEFTDPTTLAAGLQGFDEPRVGVVALPVREPHRVICGPAPNPRGVFLTDTFAGGGCLLRKDVFLALSGFRKELHHRGEETDYARCLYQQGWVVRLCPTSFVFHHASPRRDQGRDVFYQARAQVLTTVFSLPWRTLLWRSALSMGHGILRGHPLTAAQGLSVGARDGWRQRRLRKPLPRQLYIAHRRLERERVRPGGPHYTLQLADLITSLPPDPTVTGR